MKRGRPPKHPFTSMKVGDTIFIEGRKTASVKGCVNHLKPEKRFQFCNGVLDGKPGTRVWRIA